VLQLNEVASAIKERLTERGRLDWAREECLPLEASSDERQTDAIFKKLPKVSSLSGSQGATAMALVIWREETADREDKPVQKVLSDAAITELAKSQPSNESQLRELRGLHEGIARRRGSAIVQIIRESAAAPPVKAERGDRAKSDGGDAALIVLSESLVRARAVQEDLAYELLATRSDLQAVVSAVRSGSPDPDVRTLRGWRRAVVGDELLALLRGQRSLRIDDQLRVVIGD
jgi:ribonuclease D